MPWFNVDDGFAFHRKTVRAGNAALGLWVRAGSWCAQQLTDGAVPREMVEVLGTQAQASRLVSAGLWFETEEGYKFHEWTESGRNPSRSEVLQRRKKEADKKAKARGAKSTPPQVKDGCPPGTETGVPRGVPEGVDATPPLPSTPKETDSLRESGPRKRGTRLPADFTVTSEMVSWAREETPDVDGRRATAAFIDHFRSAPGQKGVKRDWVATWRNWMRRDQAEFDRHPGRSKRAQPRPSTTDRAVAQAELLKTNPNADVLAMGGFAPPPPPTVEGTLLMLPGGAA